MMKIGKNTGLFGGCIKNAFLILSVLVVTQTIADEFEKQVDYEVLARKMLQELPKLAVDGLLEASRGDVSWTFLFRPGLEKAWGEVVEVKLKRSDFNANFTDISVVAGKESSGLFGRKISIDKKSSEVWEKKIKSLFLK